MISHIHGKFNNFKIRSKTRGDNFQNAQIELKAQVNSLSTDNRNRDEHLMSKDFFEAEKFPFLEFKSTEIRQKKDCAFVMLGKLRIKDITNWVHLEMQQSKRIKDPWKGERVSINVHGEINRKDWKLDYNHADSGGLFLGDKVEINSTFQLVKQAVKEEYTPRKRKRFAKAC